MDPLVEFRLVKIRPAAVGLCCAGTRSGKSASGGRLPCGEQEQFGPGHLGKINPAMGPESSGAEAIDGRAEWVGDMSQDTPERTRGRLVRLMDFLQAVHALRYQPVRDIAEYNDFRVQDSDVEALPGIDLDIGGEEWLVIELLPQPVPPEVPEHLVVRVDGRLSMTLLPHVSLETLDAADADEVGAALDEWCETIGRKWQAEARLVEASRQLYKNLFELRTRLSREHDAFELVWGFWPIRWNSEAPVHHPLFVIPVELDYDGRRAEIVVAPSGPVQLVVDPVADLDGLSDRATLTAMRSSPTGVTDTPWSSDATDDVKRVLRAIDHDGTIGTRRQSAGAQALVYEGWHLFVRRRPTDYRGFLEALRLQFGDPDAEIPAPLAAVVVDEPSKLRADSGAGWHGPGGTEFLLPKPANEEQMRILERAVESNGVTAQGPPGTGKSHTIANLVSHFVAAGKRVLVTAQKEGALAVLADKVPEQIRPLCVAVVGSDAQNRSELERSVKTIFDRVAQADSGSSDREIERLTEAIDKTVRAIGLAESQIRDAVRYEGQEVEGEAALPSELAVWVRSEAERLNFIPDELELGTMPPVSAADIDWWFEVLRTVEPDDLHAALAPRPPAEAIIQPSELNRLARLRESSANTVAVHKPKFRSMSALDEMNAEELSDAVATIVTLAEDVANLEIGWIAQVAVELANPSMGDTWRSFLTTTSTELQKLRALNTAVQGVDIQFPSDAPLTTIQVTLLASLEDRFAQGKKLSWFGPKDAANLLAQISIDGEAPSTTSHLKLVNTESERRRVRGRVVRRWNDQVKRVDGPILGRVDDPQWKLPGEIQTLERVSALVGDFDERLRWLRSLGLVVVGRPASADLVGFSEAVAAGDARRFMRDAETALEEARAIIAPHSASALGERALAAFDANDHEALGVVRAELERLDGLQPVALRAREIRSAVSGAAPQWASAVVRRQADAGCGSAALVTEAWRWRSIETALGREHRSVSVSDLQVKISDLQERKLSLTADLVGASAWKAVAENFTDEHRLGLTAWLNATKKYGKGSGKYAPRYAAEARESLDRAKSAVPVWIMSVPTVLRTFRPGSEPAFDVVIIDEASQCGLLDMPVLALGRKVIVVGDDKQTSPENVGVNRAPVHELIEEHLGDLPNRKTVFDLDSSLYDIAQQKFPGVVVLREHFRSLPDIIEWSSKQFYGGDIVCLRDRPPSPGWVAVEAIHVPEGYVNRADSTNVVEAETIAARIAEMDADPAYAGMTFGVVTLRAGGQAKLIDELLLDAVGSQVMDARNIRCGEPAAFQGDERDVIFISVVSTKDPTTGRAPGAMTKISDERRLNVAASRARNQMVVVHAVAVEDLPKGDPRAALIRHCSDPARATEGQADLFDTCDSQFEKDVLADILQRGYTRVRTQKSVGQYRIDMVIEGPGASLAIECDGDRWHGEDRWDHDRSRQRVLERAGWIFFRVRGSAYYRDPQGSLQGLWDLLDELEIPSGDWVATLVAERAAAAEERALLSAEAAAAVEVTAAGPGSAPVAFTVPAATPFQLQSDAPANPPRMLPFLDPPDDRLLAPYESWEAREPVFASEDYTVEELGKGLARLVKVEGPIVLRRAYRLIHDAGVSRPFTPADREAFESAAAWAVASRRIEIVDPKPGSYIDSTAVLPGKPTVKLRELGDRDLQEVPATEMRRLGQRLLSRGVNPDGLSEAITLQYGLDPNPAGDAFIARTLKR